jgi:mRNA interferase RelE/StbE
MKVCLSNKAEKALNRIDKIYYRRIVDNIKGLSKDPPEGDIVKLKGKEGFRLRVGSFRILYNIVTNTENGIEQSYINVYKIAQRKEAYKK